MNILLIGPQGSGKGTQARIICEKYNFFYFESGAYLRKAAESNPDLKKSLAEGNLVPDKEMTSYLTAYLDQEDLYDNIIFDGFPRTVEQYHFFKNWLGRKHVKLDLVLLLEITEAETIRRLSARRTDPATGAIYNLITDPPPDSVEVTKLVQRDDDKPEGIKRRLTLYRERTEPLVAELKKDTDVIEINGEQPIGDIASQINQVLIEKGMK